MRQQTVTNQNTVFFNSRTKLARKSGNGLNIFIKPLPIILQGGNLFPKLLRGASKTKSLGENPYHTIGCRGFISKITPQGPKNQKFGGKPLQEGKDIIGLFYLINFSRI